MEAFEEEQMKLFSLVKGISYDPCKKASSAGSGVCIIVSMVFNSRRMSSLTTFLSESKTEFFDELVCS